MRDIALKVASEHEFFKKIEKTYIDAYKRIPGVADAVVNEWDSDSVGRKYWFDIYLQTNRDKGGKRHFAKRLDAIERQISKVCSKPDRLYNVVMPSKYRKKNVYGEWVYVYDQDYATVEIFIYNENER